MGVHDGREYAYPIWDSKVAKMWHGKPLSQNKIIKPKLYIDYANAIHGMLSDKKTQEFVADFNQAYSERLKTLDIATYELSPIRAIESAIFELSGGEYDDI